MAKPRAANRDACAGTRASADPATTVLGASNDALGLLSSLEGTDRYALSISLPQRYIGTPVHCTQSRVSRMAGAVFTGGPAEGPSHDGHPGPRGPPPCRYCLRPRAMTHALPFVRT